MHFINKLLIVLASFTPIISTAQTSSSANIAQIMDKKFQIHDASRSKIKEEKNNFSIIYSKHTSPMLGSANLMESNPTKIKRFQSTSYDVHHKDEFIGFSFNIPISD